MFAACLLKYRNKIGIDVALEALRDGWAQRKFTMDAVWHYATIDRVANVMRPYLESVAESISCGALSAALPSRQWR